MKRESRESERGSETVSGGGRRSEGRGGRRGGATGGQDCKVGAGCECTACGPPASSALGKRGLLVARGRRFSPASA